MKTLIAAALMAVACGSAAASLQPPQSFPKEYCAYKEEGTGEEVCADSLDMFFKLRDDNGEDAETPEQVQEMKRLNNPPKGN